MGRDDAGVVDYEKGHHHEVSPVRPGAAALGRRAGQAGRGGSAAKADQAAALTGFFATVVVVGAPFLAVAFLAVVFLAVAEATPVRLPLGAFFTETSPPWGASWYR